MKSEYPGAGHVVLTPSFPDPSAVEGRLADLMRLSDPALSELSLEGLLDEVLTRIREALGVDTVAILLHDDGTDELVARAARGLEAEVEAGVRIPLGRGFAGRIAAERRAIAIPELERADVVNPILHEMGLCSMLGVPLIVEAELIGVLHVGSLTPREFTDADAAVLELASARVAPAIARARLVDTLSRERMAAEALQRGLLPDVVPHVPDVDIAVRYVPARSSVGGDWYEVIPLPRNRIGIAIGDVAGHGVRAAALMAQLRAALRAYALLDPEPAAVLTNLDRYMQDSHPVGMATVAYAVLDIDTGALTYASAGHLPGLLVDDGGARMLAVPSAPPIGAQAFPQFRTLDLELPPATTLLLYTDGLVERRRESLSAGLDRLCRAAEGPSAPELVLARVLATLVGPTAADDDIAMVALQRSPTPDVLRLDCPADRLSLARLRRRLTTWMTAHGVPEDDRSLIVLAAGEAAANAIEHAYPPRPARYHVEARFEHGDVVVTVTDAGTWREASRGEFRGRGIDIMHRTMDHAEVERTEAGTTVRLRRRPRGQT